MTERFRVVPAAYVMLRRQGRGGQVLLQLRQCTGYMDGYWAMGAAGHVEAGESVLEAACREALEELGVTIDAKDLSPLCAMHRTSPTHDPVDERVDFFFECLHWRGEPREVESAKVADLQWFALDALPDPVVPHELMVLEGLRDGALDPILTFGFSPQPRGRRPAPHLRA